VPRIPGLRRAFRPVGGRVRREVDDEFAFHLEMRTRELIAAGWQPEAARLEALRQFGDLEDARAYCRRIDEQRERHAMRMELFDTVRQDLTFSLRALRRSPGFTLVAVLTLALGVGANVTMFGIVDRLLLRPPAHVRDPELVRRLYFTELRRGEPHTVPNMSYPRYVALVESMRPEAAVAAFYDTELVLGEREVARRARVTLATASYFPLLGVRPAAGRFFTAEEDTPPVGARVAVIGHALWTDEYGGSPDAVGGTVTIAGSRFQIVGVAPAGFTGVGPERVDAWVPVSALGGELLGPYVKEPWHQAANAGWLRGIARLRSEDAIARGEQLATAAYRRTMESAGRAGAGVDSLRPRATLEPLLLERGPDRTPSARIAVWLAGMSFSVLLIACANVANLLLARALRRRRETAVRVALGAGRGRLVAQFLTEGMLLALLGGAAALLVAQSGGKLVRDILVPDVEWGSALLDGRTLALAGAAVVAAGLLTGLVPALQASAVDLAGSLKAGAREGGGRRSLTRGALVVVQAALSLVLLVGAGLFLRSLHAARSVELGFEPDRVLTVNLDLAGAGYSNDESVALYEQLHEQLARLPGVEHASLGVTEPFATTINYDITIPGRDSVRLPPSGPPRVNAVTPEYFTTMGTRLVAGRGIAPGDRRGAARVAVVNQTMARALWRGGSSIGERVCFPELEGGACFEVVGVAQDARWNSLRDAPTMQIYLPLAQNPSSLPLRVLYLRAAGEPAAIARAVQREIRTLAPRVPFADVEPLAENLEPQMRPWRLGATVFTVFGVLALVLAALGLYGVIAYDVAQRMREMGVRVALGARAADVVRLVVGEGVRVAGIGVVAGTVVALAAGRWVGPLLFDTAPDDPLVLGAVALTLFGVSVAASLIPAWRATRVAPGVALRAE